MSNAEHVTCLIIGSGPAGYTAAIYAARADMKPIMYTGLTPGGQLTETTEVDNFPGYPKGITGPIMMDDLKSQAERFGTQVRFGMVTKADLKSNPKRFWVDDTIELTADSVIISTGASAKWLGLVNENRLRMNAGGVSACAVCDGFFFKKKDFLLKSFQNCFNPMFHEKFKILFSVIDDHCISLMHERCIIGFIGNVNRRFKFIKIFPGKIEDCRYLRHPLHESGIASG